MQMQEIVPTLRNPEADAEGVLGYMWADPSTGEISIPVDPVQIAKGLGVRVFEAPVGTNISGSLVKSPGQDPVILLNISDSPPRQRFTCAHELGHFVQRSGDEEFEYVEHRSPLSSGGVDPAEIHANQFAAALLMPAKVLSRLTRPGSLVEPNTGVIELATRFGVSVDAMTYRLRNLNLVPLR